MTKEEISLKTIEVINDPTSSSNNELQLAMDVVQKDYESVKNTLLKLTYHLDNLENTYNKLLNEYNNRNGITRS